MNFRQTAALGLSALMLSGNLMLPSAKATPMAISSHASAQEQLGKMIHHPISKTLLNQPVIHPVSQSQGWLEKFNLLNLLHINTQPGKPTVAKTMPLKPVALAKPLPIPHELAQPRAIQKLTVTQTTPKRAAKATPMMASKTGKVKPVLQAAIPLTPNTKLNPVLTAENESALMPLKPKAEMNTPETSTTPKITYTQIFLPKSPAQAVAKVVTAKTGRTEIYNQATVQPNPIFRPIYQTRDPQEKMMASTPRPKAAEVFQMMATSALDKLVLQTKSSDLLYGPSMDTSSAGMDTYTGHSNVKVLKSSVSQKMTSVDLTIGKAEVIYLSRPASRVSVSNPEVATAVIISPTQIQLVGKGVGVANLLVWGDMVSPDHTIVDINVHKDVSVLINQLRYVDPGIQIVPMAAEDTVILTGQAETRETAQLAIEMAKAFFSKSTVGAPQTGNGPNSQSPGSAVPGVSANVINLLKVKGEPSTKIELVRQRMRELDPNVRIEVVPGPEGNEKVILTGRVATASIASKALNLASVFYGQPGMKMITAQGGNDYTRMQVSTESTSQGSGSSSSSSSGNATTGANMLQGSVVTDATGNVISMLEIAQKPQIRCSIKFLELNKTGLNALGGTVSAMSGNTGLASWSGVQSPAPGKAISALSTQDMSGSAFSSLINRFNGTSSNTGTNIVQSRFNEVYQNGITQVLTINNQVAMAIQALQEKRQVRTLAEPTLTLLSGEQGSFLAGGEIPIAFVGGQGQVSIEYKEFGIRLNLLPNVTDDGKIQMQVAPEVSSLDQANGVSTNSVSVPAFVTRRMNTTLLVEPGQSFVLAGLYNQQDTDSMSRFPGLGSIPILGSFFKNTWSNRSKSEMVVVIRPEIINSNTGNAGPQTSLLPAAPQTAEVSKK